MQKGDVFLKRIAAFILCAILLFGLAIPAQALELSPGFAKEIETAFGRCINLLPYEIKDYRRPIKRGEFAVLSVNFIAALYGFGGADDFFLERYFVYHTDASGQPYRFENYYKWSAQDHMPYPWMNLLRNEYRPFTDVPGDSEANTLIRAAQLMGLVRGQRGGSYELNRAITRQKAAIMLGQIIYLYGPQLVNRQPVTYPDSAEIGKGPRPYVNIVSNANIMRGEGDGKFHPTDYFTVEQSLAVFNRMYDFLEKQLTPLYGYDISMEGYENRSDTYYIEYFEGYAIVCNFVGTTWGSASVELEIEPGYLWFRKYSKKGGYRGVSMTPRKPQNFRWDAENERLYFVFEDDGSACYLDTESMKIISLS